MRNQISAILLNLQAEADRRWLNAYKKFTEKRNFLQSNTIVNPIPIQKKDAWSKYDWFAILTLFLLTLAYFYNVVIPTDSRILSDQNTDTRYQLFYWRYFGFNTLAKGIMPLWNPYIYGGSPFVAGVQSALFYPLNSIFLILPIHAAINYSIILHVFLSGVFTYLYLRYIDFCGMEYGNGTSAIPSYKKGLSRPSCMISSLIFMFCAPQIFHIYPGHLPNLCTMIWLPLILLFLELFIRTRNFLYAILGGVAVAFNILAGHPQYFFYTAVAVTAYFIVRMIQEFRGHRDWKRFWYYISGFFIVYLAGILLTAIQLLPALEMIKHSTRQALTYEWVGQFSFAPENFITLFVPEFFGDLQNTPYWGRYYLWEMSLYIGILPLMLCALASFSYRTKFTNAFLIITLITCILALGKFTPLFKVLYTLVPGFNMFRGNSKFIFIVAFFLSVLSGIGAEYLQRRIQENVSPGALNKKKTFSFFPITLGIVAAVSLFVLIFFVSRTGYGMWYGIMNKVFSFGDRYTTLPNLKDPEFLRATFAVAAKGSVKCITLAIISLLVIGLWFHKSLRRCILIPVTIAVIFGDLWFFGNTYMVTFDSQQCFWNREMLTVLKNDPEPFRIATVGHFELNQGMAHDISHIGGYDANVIKEYSEFMNLLSGKPIDEPNIVVEVKQISRLTNLLNLKYILLPSNARIDHPTIKSVFRDSKYALFQNTQALPRTFIVHNARILQGRDAILKELASDEFHPLKCLILEEPSAPIINLNPENPQREPLPNIIEYSANRVTIETTLMEDGYLVLSDTFYPGWNAYVDGKKCRVLKTNYVLRSVFLEKGEHVVTFAYEPKSFSLGMVITLANMIILVPASIFCLGWPPGITKNGK